MARITITHFFRSVFLKFLGKFKFASNRSSRHAQLIYVKYLKLHCVHICIVYTQIYTIFLYFYIMLQMFYENYSHYNLSSSKVLRMMYIYIQIYYILPLPIGFFAEKCSFINLFVAAVTTGVSTTILFTAFVICCDSFFWNFENLYWNRHCTMEKKKMNKIEDNLGSQWEAQ